MKIYEGDKQPATSQIVVAIVCALLGVFTSVSI